MTTNTEQNICAECRTPIDPNAFASVVSDEVEVGEDFYHWSCAQEMYERANLAADEDDE